MERIGSRDIDGKAGGPGGEHIKSLDNWKYFGLTLAHIFRNFAARFPEKDGESERCEVSSNVSGHFCCVLVANIRGVTAAVSDQTAAPICKS
jgi:hypothetical protein